MATCAGCGRNKGFFGRLTWSLCSSCDSSYCPNCFAKLTESEHERVGRVPARDCSSCQEPILTPVFIPG